MNSDKRGSLRLVHLCRPPLAEQNRRDQAGGATTLTHPGEGAMTRANAKHRSGPDSEVLGPDHGVPE